MSVKEDLIGAKGGKGGSASFRNRPDNLRSTDTFEALIGLCSGRIRGLAPGGLQNLYVDDVPIEDGSGNTTLKDFNAVLFNGDPAILQPVTLQLGGSSGAQNINLAVNNPNQNGQPGEWRYGTVPQAGVDYIDIRLIVQSLFRQDKKGIYDATASLEVELQPSGSSQWINPLSSLSAPSYNQNGIKLTAGFTLYAPDNYWDTGTTWYDPAPGQLRITGKTTQHYIKELRVAVPNTGAYANKTWQVRIRLRERDSYTNDQDQESRVIQWESVAGVNMAPIGDREEWRGLAYLQINGKASDQLSGVPTITGVYDLSEIRVPPASVWNSETRIYTGATWDGATEEVKWTQCPAFQMKDLIEDGVSGISALTPGSTLNKWDTLEASKWFAQRVPDGQGGTQPRYSMNYILDSALSVNDLMQYVAGAVGSYAWDEGDGSWRLVVEKPENATALFTKESIVGEFNYAHTDLDGRINDMIGVFRNEARGFEEDRVRVFDQNHIDNYGRRGSSIALVGCTNRQEALRRIKIRQLASLKETRQVTFVTNRQGNMVQPFSVILVADGDLASDTLIRTTGRLVGISSNELTVRDTLRLEVGIAYKVHVTVPNPDYNPNSNAQPGSPDWRKPTITITRNITNTASARGDVKKLNIDAALPANTPANAQIALEAVGLPTLPKQYRVMAVEPQSDELVSITAIEIYTNKWNESDNVNEDEILAQRPNKVILPPLTPADGQMFSVKTFDGEFQQKRVLTVRWVRPGSIWVDGFKVEYNLNAGPWITLAEKTQDSYVELQQPQNGSYTFRITTIDRRGGVSQPLVGTYNLADTAQDYAPVQKVGPLANRPSVGSREGDKYTTNDQNPNLTYIWSNGQWLKESNFVNKADQITYIPPDGGPAVVTVQDLMPDGPGATRGAPEGTEVAGRPATQVIIDIDGVTQTVSDQVVQLRDIVKGVSDLQDVYGDTANAEASAAAAQAAANAAIDAQNNTNAALTQAQTARDAAQQARDSALDSKGAAASSASVADNARAIAQQASTDAASAKSAAESARQTAIDNAAAAAQSKSDASGFATTASGQATIATQKADAAGQSASTASAKADIATTKAGEASVSASHAATSENNASGYANAASSSAAVSASTYQKMIALNGNGNFDQGMDGWYAAGSSSMMAVPSFDGRVNTVRTTPAADGLYHNTEIYGPFVSIRDATQRFELAAGWRSSGGSDPMVFYFGAVFYDANDALITGTDGIGNYPLTGGQMSLTPSDGWVDRKVVIGKGLTSAPIGYTNYGGTLAIPANAVRFRQIGFLNYNSVNAPSDVDYFTVRDVTAEVNSNLYANASAQSASSAAASQSAAGQSAGAADTARVDAQTARSQAQSFRDQAAQSVTDAQGAASTASQQAGIATQAKVDATNRAADAGNYAGDSQRYANASSASASIASSKATEALQSAGAASTSATNAQTSATNAQTYATNASTSEQNAAGSASTATTQAGVASTARVAAVSAAASQLPNDFGQKNTFWSWQFSGPNTRSTVFDPVFFAFDGSVVRYTNNGTLPNNVQIDFAHLGSVAVQPGRTIRLTAVWRVLNSSGRNSVNAGIYAIGMDSNQSANYTPGKEVAISGGQAGWGAGASPKFITHTYDVSTDGLLANGATTLRGLFRYYSSGPNDIIELKSLKVDDVTGELNAAASASAASGSASTASTKADAAGQSASAASTSASTASTKAGEASTSASNAATSASNAQGYANTASTASGVAVSSANAARTASSLTFPDSMVAGENFFTDLAGAPSNTNPLPANWTFGDDDPWGRLLTITNPGQYQQLRTRGLIQTTGNTGRRYRLEARVRMKAAPNNGQPLTAVMTCYGLGSDYQTIFYSGYIANQTSAGQTAALYLATGWTTIQLEFEVAANAPCPWIAPSTYIYNPTGEAATGAVIQYQYFKVVDITERTLAAGSASAAAGSASTATQKATDAGNYASAANQSRADAQAAQSAASGSASAASGSAAFASGSASAAAASQQLSAAYANTVGTTANGTFAQGGARWAANGSATYGTWYNGVGFRTAGGTYGWIYHQDYTPVDTSRKYEMTMAFVVHNTSCLMYGGFTCYDVNKSELGNIYMPNVTTEPGNTVATRTYIFTGEAGTAPVYSRTNTFITGTKFVRPLALMNYPDPQPTGAVVDVTQLFLTDVTSRENAASSASVASNASASASASAASAQSSAVLSASLAGGSLNKNSVFADYPAGLTIPPSWNIWNGSGGLRTYGNGDLGTPGPSVEGSPWGFFQGTGGNNAEAGIFQDTPGGPGYFVVNATVQIREGVGFSGAGVLVYGLDGNGSVVSQDTIKFATDPDIAGTVWGRGAGPGTVTFKWSKMIAIANNNVRTIRIFAMTNWGGFDSQTSNKSLSWLRCSYRAASSAEVETGKISNLTARVSTVEGVAATAAGRTEAYFTKEVVAGGAAAFISARAKDVNGAYTSDVAIGASTISLYNQTTGGYKLAMQLAGGNAVFTGSLNVGATIRLGSGQGWPVALAQRSFNVKDNDYLAFGTDLGNVPDILFQRNNFLPISSTQTYQVYMENLTSTGGTVRVKIITPAAPTNVNLTNSTAPGSGPSRQIEKGSNPDSTDGNYNVTITVSGTAYYYSTNGSGLR